MGPRDPDNFLSATREALAEAPFDRARWREALRLLAQAGGGWGAQLIGLTSDNVVMFHHAWGIAPDTLQEFERRGGAKAAVNLRARIHLAAPLRVMGDYDLAAPKEWAANDFHKSFLKPRGAPYFLGARVPDRNGGQVALAVWRNEAQGHVQSPDMEILQSLLLDLARAIRTQQGLEDHALDFAVGAFEAAGVPVLICDGRGRAIAATPSARSRLAVDGALVVRQGRIAALDDDDHERLQAAFRRATNRDGEARAESLIFGDRLGQALVINIAPLPRLDFSLGLDQACALVFGSRADTGSADLLTSAFKISRAEAEVAIRLAEGSDIPDLAASRGVSVATIRNQRKALFFKLGVNSRAELTAKLTPLIWRK